MARKSDVVSMRLLIGLIMVICTEVFSGASIHVGMWKPWTWLVTYWLYFAHFFFCTTLAVRTGRTSLTALYLWGVLFGLYEGPITKVIWHGYHGGGVFAMGTIGPFGYSELSMAVLFHPVMAFVVPLAVACVLCPPLRALFPDLAWITGRTRGARVFQAYLVMGLGPIMAMNADGLRNLALNLALVLVLLGALLRLSRTARTVADGRPFVVFEGRAFTGVCVYLALLYGITIPLLRPDGMPSASGVVCTLLLYALALIGLRLHRRRTPGPVETVQVDPGELRLVTGLFVILLAVGLLFSPLRGRPVFFLPTYVSFALWTPLGLLLAGVAFAQGLRERLPPALSD